MYRKSKVWILLVIIFAILITLNVYLINTADRDNYVSSVAFAWIFLVPVCVFLIPRALLVWKLTSKINGGPSFSQSLKSIVPCVNSAYGIKELFGSNKFDFVITVLFYIGVVISVSLRVFMADQVLAILIASVVAIVCMALYYVQDLVFNWRVASLMGRPNAKILAVIAPPLCSLSLSNHTGKFFKEYKDVMEGTFSGAKA